MVEKPPALAWFQFGQCEEIVPVLHEVASIKFDVSSKLFQQLLKLATEAIRNSGSNGSLWNGEDMNGVNILDSLDESCQRTFQHMGYMFFIFFVLGSIVGLIFAAAIKSGASPLQSIIDKNECIAPLKKEQSDHNRLSIADERVAKKRKNRTDFARSSPCICGKEDRMMVERVLALLKAVLLDKALTDKKVAKLEQEIGRLLPGTVLTTAPTRNTSDSSKTALRKSEEKPRLLLGQQGKFGYIPDDVSRGRRDENLHLEIITDDIGMPLTSPMSSTICDEIGQNDSEYLTAMTDIKQKLADELAGVSLLLPSS